MAQSKKLVKMHTEQVAAAQEIYTIYKKFIVEEFVDSFGGSYQTAENLPCDWRDFFAYKPECEEFLIEKTKTFIHAYPDAGHFYKSPTFLKNLTSLISEHLSKYIAKKGWDRNTCTKYLKEILFDKNRHVQLELQRYADKNKRDWFKKKEEAKRLSQESEQQPRIRKHFNPANARPVHISKSEACKIETKSVKARLKEKRKELGIKTKPVVYTPEQEYQYQKQLDTFKEYKKNVLSVEISIQGIER